MACFALITICEFPEAAVTGETFAALFAGELAAINTVRTPTITPLTMPIALKPNSGIFANSSPTSNFSTAHKIQDVTIPSTTPAGTAVLHQFNASRRMKRVICRLLMPMQRIIPKN